MPVYVDGAANALGRMKMSHMLADTEDELHHMAQRIGLKREWFQNHGTPHYDVCQAKRKQAVVCGAVEIGRRDLVALIRKLRRGKHEKDVEAIEAVPPADHGLARQAIHMSGDAVGAGWDHGR